MKTRIKIIAVILLIAAMFANTAYAKDITFGVTPNAGENSNGKVWVTYNTKDRSKNSWLITNIDNTAAGSNWFVAYSDVVGFRMYGSDKSTTISNYHYFTRYVENYALPYTSTPSSKATVWLKAQADSSSARSSFLFKGKWFT